MRDRESRRLRFWLRMGMQFLNLYICNFPSSRWMRTSISDSLNSMDCSLGTHHQWHLGWLPCIAGPILRYFGTDRPRDATCLECSMILSVSRYFESNLLDVPPQAPHLGSICQSLWKICYYNRWVQILMINLPKPPLFPNTSTDTLYTWRWWQEHTSLWPRMWNDRWVSLEDALLVLSS